MRSHARERPFLRAFGRSSTSARFSARGFSANQFRLPMSRNEIGSFLGLAVETVSRVFTRFQGSGLVEADGKEVRILDHIGLCALAGGNMDA